jgi:MFS family permease
MRPIRARRIGVAMSGFGRIWSLLRESDYRRIWLTGVCSGISRWLEVLAVGVYAFEVTGSPFLVALVFVIRMTPLVLFGSLVGALADRSSPRTFMIAAMVLGLTASTIVCILLALGLSSYWVAAGTAIVFGVVWTTDMTLRRRMLGDLAGKERLVTALSFESASNNATRMLGPFLGGLLYHAFGPIGAFGLMLILYAIALFMIVRVNPGDPSKLEERPPTRIIADLREAFSLAIHDRDISRILLITAVFNIWAFPFMSMIPVIGAEQLHLNPTWIGVLASMEGMGAFIGALAVALINPSIGLRRIYFFGTVSFMVFAFIAGWITVPVLMALAILCVGLSAAGFSSMQSTLTYSVAPPHMRGRLFGLVVICIGTGLIGTANIGLMAEWFGAPIAIRIVAIEGLIAMAAIGFGWRELWNRQHA